MTDKNETEITTKDIQARLQAIPLVMPEGYYIEIHPTGVLRHRMMVLRTSDWYVTELEGNKQDIFERLTPDETGQINLIRQLEFNAWSHAIKAKILLVKPRKPQSLFGAGWHIRLSATKITASFDDGKVKPKYRKTFQCRNTVETGKSIVKAILFIIAPRRTQDQQP